MRRREFSNVCDAICCNIDASSDDGNYNDDNFNYDDNDDDVSNDDDGDEFSTETVFFEI